MVCSETSASRQRRLMSMMESHTEGSTNDESRPDLLESLQVSWRDFWWYTHDRSSPWRLAETYFWLPPKFPIPNAHFQIPPQQKGPCNICRIRGLECCNTGYCTRCIEDFPHYLQYMCRRTRLGDVPPFDHGAPIGYFSQCEDSKFLLNARVYIGEPVRFRFTVDHYSQWPLDGYTQTYRWNDEVEDESTLKVGMPPSLVPSEEQIFEWAEARMRDNNTYTLEFTRSLSLFLEAYAKAEFQLPLLSLVRNVHCLACLWNIWNHGHVREFNEDALEGNEQPLNLPLENDFKNAIMQILLRYERCVLQQLDEISNQAHRIQSRDKLALWASLWQIILVYRELLARCGRYLEGASKGLTLQHCGPIYDQYRKLNEAFLPMMFATFNSHFKTTQSFNISLEALAVVEQSPGTTKEIYQLANTLLETRESLLTNFKIRTPDAVGMFDELVLSHELKALASIRILQSLQNSAATTYETEDQDVVMEDTLPVPTQEVEFQQLQEELTSDDDMSFRDESDLESLFSDETISSNTSVSLQDHQRDATILLTDLLHKHRELYALYRIASMRVSSEKLQRHLRGFFRQYSRNLTNEARNDAERQAAAFVRSKAGYVARNIQGEVDGTKTTLALPQDSVNHMENTVNRWLASTTGSEEPQVKGPHSKKDQVTESQVTEPQTTKLRDQRLLGDRSSNLGDPTYNSSSDTTRHEKERKKETEHEDGERDDTEALSEDEDLNTPYTELDEVRHFLLSSQAFISLRSDLRRWLELDPRPRSPSPSTGSDDNEKPPRRRQVLEVSDEAREVLHYDIASAIKDDGLESSASLEMQPVETDVVLPVDDVEVHWEDSLDREATDPQKDDASMQKEPLRGVEGKPKAYGQTNPERANETSRSGRILNAVLTMMSVVGIIEAQIPRGHQRVRWTNRRGRTSYDDYMEHVPGAIHSLQNYLNSAYYRSKSASDAHQHQASGHSASSLSTDRDSANISNLPKAFDSKGNPSRHSDENPQVHHLQTDVEQGDQSIDPLHLLSCTERSRRGFQLSIDSVKHITDDRQLFKALRESYYRQKGRFRPYWSLRTVDSIHFMKFAYGGGRYIDVRCHSEICELNKPCICLPPPSLVRPRGEEYVCSPVPAKLSPPVGPNLLMDFFTDPDGIAKDSSLVLRQVPKRTYEELESRSSELVEAWGIYFMEGWNWAKIWWIMAVGFFPPSLLFGVLWGFLKQDIQGAFGVASWWMTGATIVVGIIGTSAWAI